MKTKKLLSLILLGMLCSIGNVWGGVNIFTSQKQVIEDGDWTITGPNNEASSQSSVVFPSPAAETGFPTGTRSAANYFKINGTSDLGAKLSDTKRITIEGVSTGDVVTVYWFATNTTASKVRLSYATSASKGAQIEEIEQSSVTSKNIYKTTFSALTAENITSITSGYAESEGLLYISCSNSVYVYAVKIESGTLKCATPTITPTTFSTDDQEVTISSTEGATIYYTLDGTTPTTGSSVYNGASKPTISSTTTVKAIAVKASYDNSDVATSTITKVVPASWLSWDFTNWSSATQTGILADNTNWDNKEKSDGLDWSSNNNGRSNKTTLSDATITYGSTTTTIPETDGLKFTTSAANQFALLFNLGSTDLGTYYGSKFIWLYGKNSKIIVPNVPAGATIEIGIESHKISESRKMDVSNATPSNASTTTYAVKTFTVNADGNVTINPNDKGMHIYNIAVNIPTVPISTKSGRNYGTMVTPSDKKLDFANAEGVKAYIATGFNGAKTAIVLKEISVAPANTPIIVWTETKGATVNVPVTANNPSSADVTTLASSNLVAGDGSTAWDGTAGYTYYYLASDLFHKATSGTLQSGKAYLKVLTSEVPATAPSLFFVFDEENNATDIQSIESADKAIKFFEDGKLLIMRDGVVYDALGRIIR